VRLSLILHKFEARLELVLKSPLTFHSFDSFQAFFVPCRRRVAEWQVLYTANLVLYYMKSFSQVLTWWYVR